MLVAILIEQQSQLPIAPLKLLHTRRKQLQRPTLDQQSLNRIICRRGQIDMFAVIVKGQAEIDKALNSAGLEQVDPPLPLSRQIGSWFDTDISCEEVVFWVGVANVFEGREVVRSMPGLKPLRFYPVLADHPGELQRLWSEWMKWGIRFTHEGVAP